MGNRRPRRRRPSQSVKRFSLERISASSLLFLGLVLGLAGALYYAWIVSPVVYVDASPARLSQAYKLDYISLISQNYASDQDWALAQRRLASLEDTQLPQTVAELLDTALREQRAADEIRNLAVLAQQLGAEGAAVALFAPTPLSGLIVTETAVPTPVTLPTATSTPTPRPTQTLRPTLTPTVTPQPSPTTQLIYRLLSQQRVCRSISPVPLIEVVTQDALLNPLPGVEVLVSWDGGSDRFLTGFKPEQGAGYGDFSMQPNISYSVMLADGSPEVSGLRIEPCDNGRDGGWELTFQNLLLESSETPEP